jgi:8-oxo-dGTP pyrophosphatase MutT (NUDIX family)
MTEAPPPTPIPSAAVILLRAAENGFEVLLQQRREEAKAFAGVLAFPGGKLAPVDRDPAFRAASDIASDEPYEAPRRLAALRELFEESGILLARAAGAPGYAPREIMLDAREWLEREPEAWPRVLSERRLRLAGEALVPWARWVTPVFNPRRFDSTLFVAELPPGQAPLPSREAADHVWGRPADLVAEAERGGRMIVFVTRLNLLRLAQYRSIAEVVDAARRGPHAAIQPQRVETEAGPVMRIPDDSPYPVRELPFNASSVAIEADRLKRAAEKAARDQKIQ